MNTIPQVASKSAPLSEERKEELLKGAHSYIYQNEDGIELTAHCFFPENHDPAQLKPAVIFFHGGLWDVSMTTQFAPHAMHFASRSMIGICVEYRVESNHRATPDDAFIDAQMAMLWAKHNHTALGIDPNRIIAAGAASGAHMALSLAMLPQLIEVDGYSPRPLAVIGVSAIVNTSKKGIQHDRFPDPKAANKQSPSNLVRKGLPPTLLIHGKSDTIVPYEHVAKFAKMMKRKKNPCELIDFEAVNHSFFNFNVSAKHFELTLNSMDAFLVGLDCIEPMEYL